MWIMLQRMVVTMLRNIPQHLTMVRSMLRNMLRIMPPCLEPCSKPCCEAYPEPCRHPSNHDPKRDQSPLGLQGQIEWVGGNLTRSYLASKVYGFAGALRNRINQWTNRWRKGVNKTVNLMFWESIRLHRVQGRTLYTECCLFLHLGAFSGVGCKDTHCPQ